MKITILLLVLTMGCASTLRTSRDVVEKSGDVIMFPLWALFTGAIWVAETIEDRDEKDDEK